jgi:hypothetical protein
MHGPRNKIYVLRFSLWFCYRDKGTFFFWMSLVIHQAMRYQNTVTRDLKKIELPVTILLVQTKSLSRQYPLSFMIFLCHFPSSTLIPKFTPLCSMMLRPPPPFPIYTTTLVWIFSSFFVFFFPIAVFCQCNPYCCIPLPGDGIFLVTVAHVNSGQNNFAFNLHNYTSLLACASKVNKSGERRWADMWLG